MINKKTKSTLIAVAAAYMLYIAYQLFEGRSDPETTMSPVLNTIFIVFFILAGIGLGVYAFLNWRKPDKDEQDDQDHRAENMK